MLLMLWGGFWLVITVFIRIFIIAKNRGCRIRIFICSILVGRCSSWPVSPFNWIDRVMEEVREKGRANLGEEVDTVHWVDSAKPRWSR
jgi:hypothetical protein